MSPLDDARRRARQIRSARTDEMRRALAHRVCFDLIAALRAARLTNNNNTKAHQ